MIKKMLVAVLLLPFTLKAQVTLNTQLPPAGLVQKDQLWNLLAVNNTADVLQASIKMTLQDAATGQVVLSATTGNLTLGKGVKLITIRDLQPVVYNYIVQGFSKNYLPLGTYTICYELVSDSHGEHLADDCMSVSIDPLSPPLLNAPMDNTDIQTPYPQFSWMPPTPFDMFTDLSYDLIVAEVLPGQAPSEAIQYNVPVYTKNNILQTTDNYPSAYTRLDTGKLYAWQVIARNGVSYAAKTDVWTFRVVQDGSAAPDIVSAAPFLQLSTTGTEKGVAPNGVLKIAYYNKSNSRKIKVQVYDLTQSSNGRASSRFTVNGTPGENYIQYDLRKLLEVKEGNVYMAEIINDQQEKWFVRFVIKNYKK